MQSRKKILYLITKSTLGGAQQYVFDLSTQAKELGFDVAVACGGSGPLIEHLKKRRVRTIPLVLERDVKLGHDIRAFFSILKLFRTEQPDIIHLNSSKIAALGSVAGRVYNAFRWKRKAKIIFTAHGWAFNESRPWFQRSSIIFLHWITILFSHKIIAVSKKTRHDIHWLPLAGRKTIVIYNGIEKIQFKEKEVARRRLLPHIPGQFWFGTISELHKNKGLDLAISAFLEIVERFPYAIFVIIGSGEEEKNLEAKIAEKNLQSNVFLVGQIPNAREFLKAFDVFTLTSRTEAFPYVILEAAVANLPIIASRVGGIPEVIESWQSGILVTPEKHKDLVLAFRYMLENADKAALFAENLHKRVIEQFSMDEMS
ncbi:glycosyltransferase, partial [Candidatus Parcubacteria bacterium]|nr:glycosyltransferase [Candidatus Parcubacteria bacterium]